MSECNDINFLGFLKGADFSHNRFDGDRFPRRMNLLESVEWLKLRRTRLSFIPEEFTSLRQKPEEILPPKGLKSLKKLDLSHNKLSSLVGLSCLKDLHILYCQHNNLNETDIPVELFALSNLTVLDLSHNDLTSLPKDLELCSSLVVLNLSHNKIRNINGRIFSERSALRYLDLGHNTLKTIPPELGRLSNIKTLILNNNPLGEYRMKQIKRLKSLEVLQLSNTERRVDNTENDNLPEDLIELEQLVELDLSNNQITKVPKDLIHLRGLKKLNLSENQIEKLPEDFGSWWPDLVNLNLSGNKLTRLPPSCCKLSKLRRLYINDNSLTFEGLPPALGVLQHLEVFMAGRNNLESIPESISRCGNLKKLILTSNRLKLSDPIPLLFDLETLELSNNPELEMPARTFADPSRNPEFYNVDFSLDTQRRLAGDPDSAKSIGQQSITMKDPIARKLRLRTRAKDIVEQEANQAKVLKGMNQLVTEKDKLIDNHLLCDLEEFDVKPKRWDENLEKPPIDYSDLFLDFGQYQGLTIWDIENFYPSIYPDHHGKFHDEDCYIVLSTEINENLSLTWKIFFWIGAKSTADKQACSAYHAVSLRNHLNASCRTIREEQGEESDEFLALFPDGIDYVSGHRHKCGFVEKEEIEHCNRLYRFHEVANESRQLHLQTVPFDESSLDSRFVFMFDLGNKMIIWSGLTAKNTIKQRAKLMGEKLNKEDRHSKSELIFCDQGDEPQELLDELKIDKPKPKNEYLVCPDITETDVTAFQPDRSILYQIEYCIGCFELRQVDFGNAKLLAVFLRSNNVYVLDCHTDIFVWRGRKSSKIARLGAMRIAQELHSMMIRPDFARITDFTQGNETQLFKSKFYDWDDVIEVDYTRTAQSVSKTGPDLMKWMSKQIVKTDLSPLFSPRAPSLSELDALGLIEEWTRDLQSVESIVVDRGKRFVSLDKDEFGHFYSGDSYVFFFRYSRPHDDYLSSGSDEKISDICSNDHMHMTNGHTATVTNGTGQSESIDSGDDPRSLNDEEDFKVYFWQGRHASNMGWLNFTFSLQKKIETVFGRKLDVIKMHQQKECERFLATFRRKFIIHQGKRNQSSQIVKPFQLYQLRSNNNPLTLRCIEIEPTSRNLNSGFCFILKINGSMLMEATNGSENYNHDGTTTTTNGHNEDDYNDEDELKCLIYIWIGGKSSKSEAVIAREIAEEKLTQGLTQCSIEIVQEGQEPEEFWLALGGQEEYDRDADFMNYTRLFRCSNDKGYFCISEERSDFCQDDLSDDDIMILDNGSQVILWIGPKSSEVEIRLACKSAEVYVRDLLKKESARRQLMLTFKGKESKKFTKCFHAWGEHKVVKDPRGDEARFLKAQVG